MLASGSCVPAGTDEDPAGGIDVTMLSSAATMGTPFTTPDGYTVTIHQFAMRVSAAAVATDPRTGMALGGGFGPIVVLAPIPQCHLRLSNVQEGAIVGVGIDFAESAYGDTTQTSLPPCGLAAEALKRFAEPAEDSGLDTTAPGTPTLLIDADVDDGIRHLHISAAVVANIFSGLDKNAIVTIKADTGIPVRFPVNAELFFLPADELGVSIGELFQSDADGDGTLTGAEMAIAPRPCAPTTSISTGDYDADAGASFGDDDSGDANGYEPACSTVLEDVMGQNLANLFGKGTTF